MAGYIGSKASVTQVDGYNKTEADAEFVNDPNDVITVSGSNVGIGTSSPSEKLSVAVASNSGSTLFYGGTQSDRGLKITAGNEGGFDNSAWTVNASANNSGSMLLFKTRDSEAMRIDSFGNVLVGTSTAAQTISTNNVLTLKAPNVGNVWGVGPTSSYGNFYISQAGTGVALSAGSTSWGTVSDERMKDIIEPITGASSKVASLRAVIGKYKSDPDDARRSFLIAQDVQAVLPEAIDVGEDADSTLSIKYTEVIPLLTAALQEALTKIDDLETRLTALEAV